MRFIIAAVCALVVVVAPVVAQQPPAPEGFTPLSELADRELLPATPLVFYAYGFVWLVLLAYVWSVFKRIGRVEKELDALRARIDRR